MVKRSLPLLFVIAASAASALRSLDATQTPGSGGFVMRIVATGLANPFQVTWGPDNYLWVTERTAGRVTRVDPASGSKTTAIAIGDVRTDGPGGVLGMALDPGLL